jgi:hypothetical protein
LLRHSEVFFENLNASHGLICDGHPLRDVHLVEDDAGVEAEARISFETFGQRRLVEAGIDQRDAEARRDQAALVAEVAVTRRCVDALQKDSLQKKTFIQNGA